MPQVGRASKSRKRRGDSKESEFKAWKARKLTRRLTEFRFYEFFLSAGNWLSWLKGRNGHILFHPSGRARKPQAEQSMAAQPPHGQGGFGVHSPD